MYADDFTSEKNRNPQFTAVNRQLSGHPAGSGTSHWKRAGCVIRKKGRCWA